jgi:hypothetical protein
LPSALLVLLALGAAACGSGSPGKPAATATATVTTTPASAGNRADDAFCVDGKDLETKYVGDFSFSDQAQARAAAADFRSLANRAPSAIKADMQTMATTFDRVAREGLAGFAPDRVAFETATKNVTAWIRRHCALAKPGP